MDWCLDYEIWPAGINHDIENFDISTWHLYTDSSITYGWNYAKRDLYQAPGFKISTWYNSHRCENFQDPAISGKLLSCAGESDFAAGRLGNISGSHEYCLLRPSPDNFSNPFSIQGFIKWCFEKMFSQPIQVILLCCQYFVVNPLIWLLSDSAF